jgi:hypothetical protein
MEERKLCVFSESCINLALKKSGHFISAFPGKIVFGNCSQNGYKKLEYFEFDVFELYKLYLCIFDCITYFVDDNDGQINNQLILSKYEENYFFCSKLVMCKNKPQKIVILAIEDMETTTVVFQLKMSKEDLNCFISILVKVLPCSLCLNFTQLSIFKKASHQSAQNIILLKEECIAKNFLRNFLIDNDKNFSEQLLISYSAFLSYYCEIILVFHKLESIINHENESDNVVSILRKITNDT